MTKKEMNSTLIALKKLNKVFPRMSVQQLIILLTVGVHEDIDQATIVKMTEFNKSSASKHIRKFADLTWDKQEGADYIEVRRDPMNLNTNIVKLTEKGVNFLREL